MFRQINSKPSNKTEYHEFTPQKRSAAFCYITLRKGILIPLRFFHIQKLKEVRHMWSTVSHFLSFTLGTIAGVTLMCLLQAGRQADEQFTKFFDKEGGSDE